MKIRRGFVSNSSTSSFVICGFKISDKEYDWENAYSKITGKTKEQIVELAKEYNLQQKYPSDNIKDAIRDFCEDALYNKSLFEDKDIKVETGEGVGGMIIGKTLCEISNEEYPEQGDVDIENIIEKLKIVRNKIGCDAPIRIFTGTKCC